MASRAALAGRLAALLAACTLAACGARGEQQARQVRPGGGPTQPAARQPAGSGPSPTSVAEGASRPGGPAGSPTRAPGAKGKPAEASPGAIPATGTRVLPPPREGRYVYEVREARESPYEDRVVVEVSVGGSQPQGRGVTLILTSPGTPGRDKSELVWGTEGVLELGRGDADDDSSFFRCSPPTPLLWFPLREGALFDATQSCRSSQRVQEIQSSVRMSGPEEASDAAGRRWAAWKVTRQERLSGTRQDSGARFDVETTITYWFAPELSMPLRWQETSRGTGAGPHGEDVDSNALMVLSERPS